MNATGSKRERGAYFTPAWMARALADWSIRTSRDVVIDPAAGRGELLLAAAERLLKSGGDPRGRVFGVELHERTARRLRIRLSDYAPKRNLFVGDFFSLTAKLPRCDVIIANPPYVRHQLISPRGASRMRAALNGRAHVVGGRSSAWGYFLVHSPDLLKPHGRMAFVLPVEALTSDYAGPIVDYLAGRFRTTKFLRCNGVVFRDLNQQTVLCLADDYTGVRRSRGKVEWGNIQVGDSPSHQDRLHLDGVAYKGLPTGVTLMRLLAPAGAVEIEQTLRGRPSIKPLGELASVGIGYVTGNNQFFHLSEPQHRKMRIHARHLTRVVPRAGAMSGIEYNREDWAQLHASGNPCWLLTPRTRHDDTVRQLLDKGRRAKVHKAYKCRSRPRWWRVPIKDVPSAFMSYMGAHTRVVANGASVQVSNSLYELRDLKGVSAQDLAVASVTSVFQLSAFLNARLLGGGLRKLEPADARKILVPAAHVRRSIARKIDQLMRRGLVDEARKSADSAVLVEALGLSVRVVRSIQRALSELQDA